MDSTVFVISILGVKTNIGERGIVFFAKYLLIYITQIFKTALKFVPYLEECFDVMDSETLIGLFSDRQHSTYTRDSYTGAKNETTLEEEIEFTTKLKRLNGEEKYFKNLYG